MRHFEEQLQELLDKVARMGELAESMIGQSVAALAERSESRSAAIHESEGAVNALQLEIDDLAIRLTVLLQPAARDARFLFMASRIGGELERIGDQAINILQNTHHVLEGPPLSSTYEIPAMAEAARKMVRDALDAMIKRDVALANTVLEDEKTVDELRRRSFRALLQRMMDDPNTVPRATSLILIARNLERVGDHATNIAEEVIYWIQGRDIRHGKGRPVVTPTSPP